MIPDTPDLEIESSMDKLLEAEKELRELAQRSLDAADEIAQIRRRMAGAARPQILPRKPAIQPSPSEGYIAVAVAVLRERGEALHIDELTKLVGEKMGKRVSRDSVEAAVWRGLSTPKWKGILIKAGRATYTVDDGPKQLGLN
jgi:hypothetical protein